MYSVWVHSSILCHFLQGARKTRLCLSGRFVKYDFGIFFTNKDKSSIRAQGVTEVLNSTRGGKGGGEQERREKRKGNLG